MPMYDFKCLACDLEVELSFSFNDLKEPHCPICKAVMVQVYQSTPIHFKGDGWAGKG